MNILQPKYLKQTAASILSGTAPNYRKLVCIHAAVSLGVSLLLTVVDLLLSFAVSSASDGLSAMDNQILWETVRTVLSLGVTLVLPVWQLGILYTSVRVTRRQPTTPAHLTRGFHRLLPVALYYILMFGLITGTAVACSYAAMPLTTLLPLPPELESAIMNLDEATLQDPQKLMASIDMGQLLKSLTPVLILITVLYGAVLIYLFYRFRFCTYLLLDEPRAGAIQTMTFSGRMTKGQKWNLFKLDLSFWWYYGLQLIISAVISAPVFLELSGMSTALPYPVLTLIFQAIGSLGSLALSWWAGAYVEVTYACAYGELCKPPQPL